MCRLGGQANGLNAHVRRLLDSMLQHIVTWQHVLRLHDTLYRAPRLPGCVQVPWVSFAGLEEVRLLLIDTLRISTPRCCYVLSPLCHCCWPTVWISGCVQTAIYGDFFYYYYLAWKNNQKLSLPA